MSLPIPIPARRAASTSDVHDAPRVSIPHDPRDRYTFHGADANPAPLTAAAFASVDDVSASSGQLHAYPQSLQGYQFPSLASTSGAGADLYGRLKTQHDADKRFERELADAGMDQYVFFDFEAFNAAGPSPIAAGIVGSSASHAQHTSDTVSPATPALSLPPSRAYTLHDNSSALSAATGSASPFSPFLDSPDAVPPPLDSSSPAGCPLSSPDMPMDLEPASAQGDASGLLLYNQFDPFSSSYGASQAEMESSVFWGHDFEMGAQAPPALFKDPTSAQPQPQSFFPSMDQPQQQQPQQSAEAYMQQAPEQFAFPQFGAYTQPGVEPRSLTLDPSAAPAARSSPSPLVPGTPHTAFTPSTPSWAARLWDEPAPPFSASAAIPIPQQQQQQEPSSPFAHVFQPASAPPHGGLGLGLGATSFDFGFSGDASTQSAHQENATASSFTPAGNAGLSRHSGGGGTVRASRLGQRVRSISQRAGSGISHAIRAVATLSSARDVDHHHGAFDRSTIRRRGSDAPAPSASLHASSAAHLPLPPPLHLYNAEAETEDRDATVRRRKKPGSGASPSPRTRPSALAAAAADEYAVSSGTHSREGSSEKEREDDTASNNGRASSVAPAVQTRSELKPPKLAPSTWQLFFTHWIQQRQTQHGDRKLNVAQAAKEAGAVYASLTPEEKEPYKRQSQAAKALRERELEAWQRTLTPEDIRRENVFRAAQRKAGKSRRGNIKDPNAPKKPLSAYFMFLQHIRADAERVRDVFGEERETTAQSVLAAYKWRSMSDEERKPFLAQAEREKLSYEAARRVYEDGNPNSGFVESTMSFSLSPAASGSGGGAFGETTFVFAQPAFAGLGAGAGSGEESEMESEGFSTDEERDRERPSSSSSFAGVFQL